MKVIFSHGKESGPWGSKIKHLANIATQHGCEVDSIDYTDLFDPDKRVDRLVELLNNESEDVVLVGSSMGGYVSLVTSAQVNVKAVFLLAPALYIEEYSVQHYEFSCPMLEIVHGWADDVIPVENSIRFAQDVNCSLHLIPGDHRLNSSIEEVSVLFEQFIIKTMGE